MKQKKETHAQKHCERSVAIARLSNRTSDAITTQTSFARNDKRRAFTLAEGATHVGTCDNVRKSAFTLAEVLITLAIIGVVAAMTIPTLIGNYKKNLVETRIKQFYVQINQAIRLSEIDNGDKKTWAYTHSTSSAYSEETLRNFYNTYLNNYLKVLKTEYTESVYDGATRNALRVYFLNGSAVDIRYGGSDYIFYPEANNTKDEHCECKSCFFFGLYPNGAVGERDNHFLNKGVEPYLSYEWDGTYESLIELKQCAKIIQLNGWKIPDDYPYKF